MARKHWLSIVTLIGVQLLAIPDSLYAQALDVGGIEVQIGQPISNALVQLRAVYDVRFDEGFKRWFVTRKNGEQFVLVGSISVESDRITMIQKAYDFDGDMDRASETYGVALRDTQRRGGKVCETTFREWPNGDVQSVVSICGRYTLAFSLPFLTKDASNSRVRAGVSVTVK